MATTLLPRQPVPDHEPTSERSYGIIPIRLSPAAAFSSSATTPALSSSTTQVLLIQQKALRNAHEPFWSFPKGHPEPNDTSPHATALRELREETGLVVSEAGILFPDAEGLSERYRNVLKGWVKEVRYWVGLVEEAGDGMEAIRVQEKELLDARWCSWEEAERVVTFEAGRRLLRVAKSLLDGDGAGKGVGEEKL